MLKIKVKYHVEDLFKLEFIGENVSDWVDLRAAEKVELKKGDFKLISLGVSLQLPEGYEAHIAPRSSTFKNWGILQTNCVGVVDESYCGNEDLWKYPVCATKDTVIEKNDRIAQFRLVEKMPKIQFVEVEYLDNKNRGGFGSTGKI